MIPMKCTMHLGHKYSRKHNVRDFDAKEWNKDGHINPDREHLNSVLVDTDYVTFIDENFGDALVDFNEKKYQKHPDRLIGFNSNAAYEKCSDKERRSRAVKAYAKEHKKDVQEAIIQLGDHGEYEEMVKIHGEKNADEMYKLYLTEAFEKWKADNPSLKVFCAAVHMDETKDGTPHLHVDFLPVAESDKGLSVKVSMDGAMKKMGFVRKTKAKDGEGDKYAETPYKRWLNNRRQQFEDFAQQFSNEHKLGIVILPSEKSTAPHEQPQDFKARKERKKASSGKIAALKGKDKKLQLDAAEFIISNAQAVTDSLTAELKEEKRATAEAFAAANVAQKSYENARKTADEERLQASAERANLATERAELADKSKAVDKSINQQVRRRLQGEKLHRDMSKVSSAQQRRMKQIGVMIDENGVTVSKER